MPGEKLVSDAGTKSLPRDVFERHMRSMGLREYNANYDADFLNEHMGQMEVEIAAKKAKAKAAKSTSSASSAARG